MRRAMLTAAILACVLGLSACNDDPPGSGSPKTGASGNTAAPTGGSSKTGTPLAGTDPCTLLKPADVPELDQHAYSKPKTLSREHPTCAGYDFALTIVDNDQNARDLDFGSSGVQPVPDIAGHRAVTRRSKVGPVESCSVSMEVTADEHVRLQITHDEDPSKMCDIAVTAATVVASRIPA